jgi:hypothetical protein
VGHSAQASEVLEGVDARWVRFEAGVDGLCFSGDFFLAADGARRAEGFAEDAFGELIEAGAHGEADGT